MDQPPVNLCLFDEIVPERAPQPERIRIDHAALWQQEMTEIVRERLSVGDPWASAMAREIVEGLRARLGGDDIYVPAPDRRARNARIRALFNGRNIDELCELFDLSRSTVYLICQRSCAA
jgi:Mor family transcriptional regulator